ncbi:MAG: EAL domain-containing protein [Spirochaetales bacterium]|nr:EAL domain-containing protein [Spirochaetales bacterium]
MKGKRFAILFLTFLTLLAGLFAQEAPAAEKGFLDLRGMDLENSHFLLKGEWAFYPGILSALPPKGETPEYIGVPSVWESRNNTRFGAGTYLLTVDPGGYKGLLALRVVENIQALRISVNGQEIFQTGLVSTEKNGSRPGINKGAAVFQSPGEKFVLTIEVSNWQHRQSGLCKNIQFGSYSAVMKPYRLLVMADIFIIGMAFTFFFLYMAHYIKRPEDKVTLWFSLLCLVLGIRTGLTNTSQLELLLGEGMVLISKKIEYLTFIGAVLFFISYVENLVKRFRIRWFSWIIPLPLLFYGLIIIFTPMNVYSFLLPFFQFYSFVYAFYLFYFFYRSIREPHHASYRLIGEILFMVISLIYDVLFYNDILHHGPIAGFSLMFVIFLEGLSQARLLSEVLTKLEILTSKYRRSIEEISQSRMEIEQQNKQLNWLALYDQLTGLPNRYNLMEVLNMELSRAERNSTRIAVVYMDVDNFKDINDSLGHNRGDELLRSIGDRLKGAIRKTDSLFRVGGDKFTLVYNDLNETKQLNRIMDKLRKILDQPFAIRNEPLSISFSMGVAFFPDNGRDLDLLIKNAELAMYQAKNQGRNHVVTFNDHINNDILSRLSISARMKRALEMGRFKLYYQAQIDASTEKLFGFEALIRWIDPENGIIMPDMFIPLAEENGFIAQIGRWTLQEACRQIGEWYGKGYRGFTISVNISAYQFGLDHFIFDFREILEKSRIDPSYLKVELTETMLMANPHLAQRKMEQIREMGVQIALDDFGTGYSSLSYLNIFPVTYLKIDKAFIRDVHKDGFNKKLTTSIITLGKNLELQLIAEGVESVEEKDFLLGEGCRIIQGYLYSRPVPPQAAEEEHLRIAGPAAE